MTPFEAAEYIKSTIKVSTLTTSQKIAFNLAIEALEKQIPKKVKNKMNDYGICPVCEHSFVGEIEYCTKCGNVLDWS